MRNAILVVVLIILAVNGTTSIGAQCGDPTGEWGWGPTLGAAGNGEIAVFGSGRVLRLADITDPTDPVPLSHVTLGDLVRSVAIRGPYAFVAASQAGLVVVDFSNPRRPVPVTTWATDDMVIDVTLAGHRAYVANRFEGMAILDISDPTDLIELGAVDVSGLAWDVAVHDELAFVADSHDGLHVVDVSDPANPTIIASLTEAGRCYAVDVSGDARWVYVADYFEGMRIIDASNPASPSLAAFVDVYDYATDVTTRGSFVYLGNRGNGLRIYDVSDPTEPVEIRRVDHDGETQGVRLDGDLAYLANFSAGLRVVDIAVPEDAEELGFIDGKPSLYSPAVDGDLAILPGGGLMVTLDVSDPSNPVEIATIDVPGYAYAAAINGDLAFIADGTGGLDVLDASDPQNLVWIASAETPDAHDVAVADSTVFLSCYSDGVRIVDVSEPDEPVVIGSIEGINNRYLAQADGMLYVPEHDMGLHIFDVTDPSSPFEVVVLDLPEAYNRPVVYNDLLFVPAAGHGVHIFDVGEPRSPEEIALIPDARYVYGIAVAGDLLFLSDIYDGSFVFDISDPTTPIELAATPLATTAEGELAGQGALILIAEDRAGIQLFDLNACFSEPPTADFTWRPVKPEAGRRVQLTDTSIGSIDEWRWSFGDGVTSSLRNPTHTWTQAGDHDVTLTVSGSFGSQSMTRVMTILQRPGDVPPITEPGEFAYVIAASAHASGLEGTQWVTDGVLHNPGSETTEAFLWFMKAGQNNQGAIGVGVSIAPGASQLIEDVVLSVFHEDEAAGAILVGADHPLVVTSRTYNDAPSGTFGQFIPGRDLHGGIAQNQSAHLIHLTRSDTFRTNLGVANPTADALQVGISLRNGQGEEVNSLTMTVPPFGFNQRTDILGVDTEDAYAVVTSTTPGASYFPYASVVDNRTGDPMMVEALQPSDDLVIAASAHVGGFENTDWRTDLELCNPLGASAELQLNLLKSGIDNSSPPSVPVTLEASCCDRLSDVLDTVFSHEGTAALQVLSPSGNVFVSSRTFNSTDAGTFGQFVPGIARSDAIRFGEQARIVHLVQGDSDTTGSRTNVGYVNRSSTPTVVQSALYTASGTHLGTVTTTLQPFEHRQINRVFRQVTSSPITSGYAIVTTPTSGGSFIAYASVVDNTSGDPIFIPATRFAAAPSIDFELLTTGLGGSGGNYGSDADLELACTSWGGHTAFVADWRDIITVWQADGDDFADPAWILSGRSYLIKNDDQSFRPDTNEHYLIARHDRDLPPDFDSLDDVGDHFIDLGSGEDVTLQVVCRRPLP